MGVIYKITSPSNKLYVGKTYDLRKRINSHKCAVKYGKNVILHNSIRKYGWDAHILEIIEEVDDSLMDEREMFWITKLKTYCYDNPAGLNMTKGGDGQRSTWMHETNRRKDQSKRFSKSGNPFFGKKHTEETKKIIGRKASERNKSTGATIPKWGAEKGRLNVIRSVVAYDKYGHLIGEFESLTNASAELNANIHSIIESCQNIISGVNGKYVFRYKTDNYPSRIYVGEIKTKSVKRAVLSLSEGYEVLCEHPSAKEASDFWGIPKGTINRAAKYNWLTPIRSGHVFIYKDLYEEIHQAI